AVLGLMLVLGVFGVLVIDPLGALWAAAAATGLAAYFVVSADDSHGLPPLALATGGLFVGALVLMLFGASGVLDMRWSAADVSLAGVMAPWWAVIAALGLFAAAFAYGAGVTASRRLGSKLASFVGLSE